MLLLTPDDQSLPEWHIPVSAAITWYAWHTWGPDTTWVDGRLETADGQRLQGLDIGTPADECCISAETATGAATAWAEGQVYVHIIEGVGVPCLVIPTAALEDGLTRAVMAEALGRYRP